MNAVGPVHCKSIRVIKLIGVINVISVTYNVITIIIAIAFKISMTELRNRMSNIDMAKPQKMCVAYLDILGYSNFIKECDPTVAAACRVLESIPRYPSHRDRTLPSRYHLRRRWRSACPHP